MKARFTLIRELTWEWEGVLVIVASQDAERNAAAALSYAGKIYPHQIIAVGVGRWFCSYDVVIVAVPRCREECRCFSQLCRQDLPSSEN
jgi:hypothetical protein